MRFLFLTLSSFSQCGKMGQCDIQCPVCTEPLSELAKPLPYSHCAQSHLICALSGKVMDDNNPPMALPNGYVYGENVSEIFSENGLLNMYSISFRH